MSNSRILLLFVFLTYAAVAQEKRIVPVSPEAAGLAKFLNYPVNYSTGLPDINVPIFEIQAGDITLPIKLSYHAGGIKIDEKSTWVGLGWQLDVEPSITRKINNVADELSYLQQAVSGEYAVHNLTYLKSMVYTGRDEEPDEYYYKLSGSGGKFFYRKSPDGSYKALPVPYSPIIINNDKTIVDMDGTLYRFGTSLTGVNAIEIATIAEPIISTWKCTEIISASKQDTISFKYTDQ